MKLYIKRNIIKEGDTAYIFLYKLLFSPITKGRNRPGVPATYTSPDCNDRTLQCPKDKARSFDELYYLVKTYFPKITLITFTKYLKYILNMTKRDNSTSVVNNCLIFCPDVKKWVIQTDWLTLDRKLTFFDNLVYNYNKSIENHYNDAGKGKHSLIDILKLMGITNGRIAEEIGTAVLYNKLENSNS